MRKILSKFLWLCFLIAGFLQTTFLQATEMRTPWISERGPISYIIEPVKEEKWSLDVFALAESKEAEKAYMQHGFETHPLSTLFFNKSDFAIADAFPNETTSTNAEYYNPYLEIIKIHPRVTYYESGVNLGARFEYPVCKNKGRIGLRTNIPLRSIELERENISDNQSDPNEDYILSRTIKLETGVDSVAANDVDKTVTAYSFDLLYRLFQDANRHPAVETSGAVAPFSFKVFGEALAKQAFNFANNKQMSADLDHPCAAVIFKESGTGAPGMPNEPTIARAAEHWAFNSMDTQQRDYSNISVTDIGQPETTPYPNTAPGMIKNVYFFKDSENYPAQEDKLATNLKNNGWLIFGYDNGALENGATNIKNGIEDALKLYEENPYEWLWTHGEFELETQRRTGLGDIDLDLFYEHRFSNSFVAEGFVGLRFPTGENDDYSGNPYNVHLGNGEHWEIKLGGLVAAKPVYWMNLKLDTYFSFVLEGSETRSAVFEGSSVKNIGPAVDADVSWQYFVMRLDGNFFHPRTENVSATLGYELYLKTKDDIDFKQTTATPFYGDHYNGTDSLAANLSGSLAAANTQAVGHKIRAELRAVLSDWVSLFGGGSFVFAGKNVPRDSDMHCGLSVKF
ncbi:MAG: hypothetical protein SZ59_C0002G0217 [candidate division TM6 bacterium GW2011_GWF2_28_16]|nr:MAG: hypothetical protein SZ59_C0002G0217 [candidate division TM6 bacterium GW2011_GWF2_28_16]